MSDLFAARLAAGLAGLGREISPEALARLGLYATELEKWGKKMNLVARGTTVEGLVENHFLDSLLLLPLLTGPLRQLLDIGSGAGFPGLVCAAAYPEMAVTLVEPRQKRAGFLRHVVRTLALPRVEVLECRVEDQVALPPSRRFSHITARAVADLAELLAMVDRFAAGACQLLWLKGPKWREELAAAGAALARSRYLLDRVVEERLPFSGACRSIVIFRVRQQPTTEVGQ